MNLLISCYQIYVPSSYIGEKGRNARTASEIRYKIGEKSVSEAIRHSATKT